VWPGYDNMGFAQNFGVKTSLKMTTLKTKDEMGWQYLRRFFGQNSLRKPRKSQIILTLKHLAMILYHQNNSYLKLKSSSIIF
jgi:hypothetical protein